MRKNLLGSSSAVKDQDCSETQANSTAIRTEKNHIMVSIDTKCEVLLQLAGAQLQ